MPKLKNLTSYFNVIKLLFSADQMSMCGPIINGFNNFIGSTIPSVIKGTRILRNWYADHRT